MFSLLFMAQRFSDHLREALQSDACLPSPSARVHFRRRVVMSIEALQIQRQERRILSALHQYFRPPTLAHARQIKSFITAVLQQQTPTWQHRLLSSFALFSRKAFASALVFQIQSKPWQTAEPNFYC